MRMRLYPCERLLFRFEKAIDDDGVALSRSSHASFGSFGETEAVRAGASESRRLLREEIAFRPDDIKPLFALSRVVVRWD